MGALGWEPLGGNLVVEWVYGHQGNIGNGTVPMLVLDIAKRFSSVRRLALLL